MRTASDIICNRGAIAGMDYKLVAVHSYNQFFDTMIAKLPRAAMVEGLRRMVFNVLGAQTMIIRKTYHSCGARAALAGAFARL